MADFTLFGLAAHFVELGAEMAVETHHALEHAAVLVETEAKAEIGVYQGAAGPFAAWQTLAPFTQADRVAKGFSANDPLLRTGELRDSIEHTVGVNEAEVGSNSDIALFQELGTRGGGRGGPIPPRSFLGGAAFRKAPQIRDDCAIGAVQVLSGGGTRVRIP
jgi:phage gpG-like protein